MIERNSPDLTVFELSLGKMDIMLLQHNDVDCRLYDVSLHLAQMQ